MVVRFAVRTLAWVSTAPRGITSTAAVTMTANGSAAATSAGGGTGPSRVSSAKGLNPSPVAGPSRYQCGIAGLLRGQPLTAARVDASATNIAGPARSTTRSTSAPVSRQ